MKNYSSACRKLCSRMEVLKVKKNKIETLCILCNEACSEKCKFQEVGWNSMREKAKA